MHWWEEYHCLHHALSLFFCPRRFVLRATEAIRELPWDQPLPLSWDAPRNRSLGEPGAAVRGMPL